MELITIFFDGREGPGQVGWSSFGGPVLGCVKEKSVEELNAQLVSLVGENGAEMLISSFKSARSISGPELA